MAPLLCFLRANPIVLERTLYAFSYDGEEPAPEPEENRHPAFTPLRCIALMSAILWYLGSENAEFFRWREKEKVKPPAAAGETAPPTAKDAARDWEKPHQPLILMKPFLESKFARSQVRPTALAENAKTSPQLWAKQQERLVLAERGYESGVRPKLLRSGDDSALKLRAKRMKKLMAVDPSTLTAAQLLELQSYVREQKEKQSQSESSTAAAVSGGANPYLAAMQVEADKLPTAAGTGVTTPSAPSDLAALAAQQQQQLQLHLQHEMKQMQQLMFGGSINASPPLPLPLPVPLPIPAPSPLPVAAVATVPTPPPPKPQKSFEDELEALMAIKKKKKGLATPTAASGSAATASGTATATAPTPDTAMTDAPATSPVTAAASPDPTAGSNASTAAVAATGLAAPVLSTPAATTSADATESTPATVSAPTNGTDSAAPVTESATAAPAARSDSHEARYDDLREFHLLRS